MRASASVHVIDGVCVRVPGSATRGRQRMARQPILARQGDAFSVVDSGATPQNCKASLLWPVLPAHVVRKFQTPKGQWGPGHRGVDLQAVPGTPLLAPGAGIISFVGVVAGKNVVSIQSKAFTLTFEPAMTELTVGTPVIKAAPFAKVGGISDHCAATCVHWGVRRAIREYTDPELLASKQKIVLKDTDDEA